MKRILLLLVAITAFSCSSDDSQPVENNPNIVGQWREVAMKMNNEAPEQDKSNCDIVEHANLYTINNDGSIITQNACGDSNVNTHSYLYSGNNFTLDMGMIKYVYSVQSIGSNKIKLTLLSSTISGETTDESNSGYYEIYQKQ